MEECMVVNKGEDLMDLPPGFRFHPTDEEIITHYLTEKVMNNRFFAVAIVEADLNRCEPWDLPKKAKIGENKWYFFCQKDRKYPTGMRTNRATEAGYWKATGKDKEIYKGKGVLVGMKKTLVFYKGRAPKGEKTNWVMHEYRLEGQFSYYNLRKSPKDEWVVCRVHHKTAGPKKNPIYDLLRTTSIDELDHLLDYSSIPPLMDPSFSGQPGSSLTVTNTTQPIAMNNNNQNFENTNFHQTSMNPLLNPQNPLQNPISSHDGAISGSDFRGVAAKNDEMLYYRVEQISSNQSGLSAEANANTAEISSKQKKIIGSSNMSYEDFADMENIWGYY